jgi:hypothetical protein
MDYSTGLEYYNARWFDPGSGRFVSQDPLGLGPDSNPYRYVHNSPGNGTDPSGLLDADEVWRQFKEKDPVAFYYYKHVVNGKIKTWETHWYSFVDRDFWFTSEKDGNRYIPTLEIYDNQTIDTAVDALRTRVYRWSDFKTWAIRNNFIDATPQASISPAPDTREYRDWMNQRERERTEARVARGESRIYIALEAFFLPGGAFDTVVLGLGGFTAGYYRISAPGVETAWGARLDPVVKAGPLQPRSSPPPVDPPAPGPNIESAPAKVIEVDPATLRWSQTTAGGKGRAGPMRASMAEKGWAGDPIDVVQTADGLVTVDHTRAAVALEQGIKRIPVRVHLPDEPLPADMLTRPWDRNGTTATTWGEAVKIRGAGQKPPIGPTGTPTPPKLPTKE